MPRNSGCLRYRHNVKLAFKRYYVRRFANRPWNSVSERFLVVVIEPEMGYLFLAL